MKFLLDTSVLLWSVAERPKLNSRAIRILSLAGSNLYLSAASVWEIAIKYAIGRLPLHVEPELFVAEVHHKTGMRPLDIDHLHAVEAGRLPRHHGDPFDRMLIAQARTERMVLLTADRIFQSYEVEQEYCGL
jgi:PIN domain nuclease of toxin-antitoxin system